jgi:hypothetical protein
MWRNPISKENKMFEQISKAFQDAGAGAFYRASQDAAVVAQKHVAKATADATEYAQMEVANVLAIAQSRKPEDAIGALTKAFNSRQEFLARKTKELFDEVSSASAEMARMAEDKSQDFATQANNVVDTAFANVKQGLGLAESAAKSAVAKASKGKKA